MAEEEIGIQLKEFSIALGQIAEEKGISREKVLETVEAALSAAYKKDYGKRGQHIRAEFDDTVGHAKFFLVKEVVDETTREFVKEEETENGEQEGDRRGAVLASEAQDIESNEERLPRYNEERDITLEDALKFKKKIAVGEVLEFPLESHETFGRVAAQTAKQVIIQKIREAER
jgi:N utilization substance protein A